MSANFTLVPTMNASAAAVVSIVPHVFREGAEVAKARKTELIGRDVELKRLSTFVDGSPRGPAFVLVEGEAGIGKSTLWEWAVGQAREHGRLVLTSRPNSNDIALAYAALGDLLDETLDEALEQPSERSRRPRRYSSPSMTHSGSTDRLRPCSSSLCAGCGASRSPCSPLAGRASPAASGCRTPSS